MKTINLGHAKICLIDDHIVLFEANPDVVIGREEAQAFYDKIEQHVDGNYSLIINRRNKYQLLRFEVFKVINSRVRLQGLAIVASKDSAQKMAKIEAPLCEKPFATFCSVDDAVDWLKTLHQK